jgi:hypothetical protein
MTAKITSIRDDPDRIEIALIDALLSLRVWRSERACVTDVVYLLSEVPGKAGKLSTRTIAGRVKTLTAKRRKYRTGANLHWRTAMSAAFWVVFTIPDKAQAERLALLAAKRAGEEDEIPRLWQMIDAKFLSKLAQHNIHFSKSELV